MTHITKHTPGPWVVVSTFNGTRFVETQEGHSVCVLADTNDAANAHLIAAAPAMYEALQHALAVCESEAELRGDSDSDDYLGGAARPVAQMIRHALAQAEGKA